MFSPSWILLESFSTSLGNCQAPCPNTVTEYSGHTATYDASPWLSHTLMQLQETKCVCGGAGSPFFLVTAISFTPKSSAPSGKMQASHWKTSKQGTQMCSIFATHVISQCVNISIGKGHVSRSRRATSCALDREWVLLCTGLHLPLVRLLLPKPDL